MFMAAALILLPVALLIEQPWQLRGGPELVGWLFAMAVVGTIVPAALNYLLVQQRGRHARVGRDVPDADDRGAVRRACSWASGSAPRRSWAWR